MSSLTFEYKGRDRNGAIQSGTMEATSPGAVAKTLRDKGFMPIRVVETKKSGFDKDIKIPGLTDKVKTKDLSIFSRQLATMVNSGLTLIRSLSILESQIENSTLAQTVTEVKAKVESGSSLSAALEMHPKIFGTLYISMIRAGEVGGALDETLERLSDTLEAQVRLRSKVKSAMAYPVVVMSLVVFILVAMLVFVVPIFEGMYRDLGGALPMPTQLLINISSI
ncbi:type II secretion system F family protein, partial [bacterium]|nr:type II secretion system F family protein [bacterium]